MPRKGVLLFAEGAGQNGSTSRASHVPALEAVANRPIAHHVLDALLATGVDHVIVTGVSDVLIDVHACLNTYEPKPARLDYAVCAHQADCISSLRAALPFVGAAPCVAHVGDGLLDGSLMPYVEDAQERSLDLLLVCQSPAVSSRLSGIAQQQRIQTATIPDILCDAGIGVFAPGAFRTACEAAFQDQGGGSLDLLARDLSDQGRRIQVCLAEGWRRYRGNPVDLLEVNRLALDRLSPRPRVRSDGRNQIEGRVQIDHTASVTTSVIVGPVVVGEGAEVTNAYIGPYTSIGAGARIEGVEIERSIISPGASVMHVGARVVSSLVGRGAHVFRDFSLPRAMRLRVGEGNEVALC